MQAEALAKGNKIDLQLVDLRKIPLSETQLQQLIQEFDGKAEALLDRQSEDFKLLALDEKALDQNGLLKILEENQTLLKTPLISAGGTLKILNQVRSILHYQNTEPQIDPYNHQNV
jgi:arsenate reductase-like glutaredoxin family protein